MSKVGNLVWVDLEMTGLNPDHDRIIEMAVIITDGNLNILMEGPVFAIHQSDDILAGMDEWNTKTHTKSGLVERVRHSTTSEEQAQAKIIEFLLDYVQPGKSPMCGSSICQDRRFLFRWMPKLEQFFHYRNLDVSSVKILAQCWAPAILKNLKRDSRHVALDDIRDSINEMRYYRDNFFRLPQVIAN